MCRITTSRSVLFKKKEEEVINSLITFKLITAEAVPTKRSIRVQTWKKIQNSKVSALRRSVFNRIPNFIGADKAAELLSETDEFKNASKLIHFFFINS